jgi:hypothetical protein
MRWCSTSLRRAVAGTSASSSAKGARARSRASS